MAGMWSFPVVALVSLVLVSSSATAHNDFHSWLENNKAMYEARMGQIANGINVTMEDALAVAENGTKVLVVCKDGSCDYGTLQAAVDSIPVGNTQRYILKIKPGLYKEKVNVPRTKPFVTFLGDPINMPTISYNGNSAKYGTWNSATVIVEADYFIAMNVIFENSSPRPKDGEEGQAVALRISGDKAAFYRCRFIGFQDTLCDDVGRHLFKNCFIQGTVDFIFGAARSLYSNCEINSVATGRTAITAQARSSESDEGGFSFVNCKITGTGQATLSRAWRKYSRVIFARTYMGNLIDKLGWDNHGYTDRDQTVFYGEYQCFGPGATMDGRVPYAKKLRTEDVKPFLDVTYILGRTWLRTPPPFQNLN
ncbi:probable pectinesterase 50 [Amborella trichopoda]|uniref:Pectinesterase n=1 Tax=Amborella trichopoda TaxID=13333 RepID=W1P6M7_AMBTC|nr:probable pectinesterase 50 [Amborella trichopoda]ERN05537.1 hypothetical protein AMTR_s00007p00264370 [Amborella trichopoda]|eukprot:XP_006843862.1 probable pectinesterase 50 [Amborella trichopoda]